jgi:hypothetical protein
VGSRLKLDITPLAILGVKDMLRLCGFSCQKRGLYGGVTILCTRCRSESPQYSTAFGNNSVVVVAWTANRQSVLNTWKAANPNVSARDLDSRFRNKCPQ